MPEIIGRRTFGTLDDSTSIELLTIRNAAGVELGVINYGCIIVSLSVPDSRGRTGNVVLGYERLEPYLQSSPYFGALVGRCANRIANARFSIDGRVHHLSVNDPPNHLHGGFRGFDKRVWEAETVERSNAVVFRRSSADGEEGYPGRLDVEVTYSVGDRNDVWMDCRAETDAPTHVNLTQHSYFNLRGEGDALSHCLAINANTYLPIDARLMPTGEVAPVANTPFDFQEPSEVGARIRAGHEQLTIGGGYDHTFFLNRGDGDLALAARVFDPSSGRTLEISTTEPGLQFYSGQVVGHRGLCLEPQHFPDSPNRPEFPPTLLRPGARYRTQTRYSFST
jgi:aldose 1-epimerase